MKSLAIKVFFSIPFAAKRDDASWRRENDLFGHSLASVLNQTDSDLDVIVCGHDRPRCSQLDDPRVTFLSAPFPPPEDKSQFLTDKKRKRRETFNEIRRRGGGYVVLQDADDLVNRTLVDFIRQDRAPHGYTGRRATSRPCRERGTPPSTGGAAPPQCSASLLRICGRGCSSSALTLGTTRRDMSARKRPQWPLGAPSRPCPFPAQSTSSIRARTPLPSCRGTKRT
jgi:hypothetical protein